MNSALYIFLYPLYILISSPIWLIIFLLAIPVFLLVLSLDLIVNRKRHLYHLKKLIKQISYYSLINKWILIIYSVIIIAILAIDYLVYENTPKIHYSQYSSVIQNFLRVNSLLTGLSISILLLAFKVLNDRYGDFAFRAVFTLKKNRVLITMFVFNFIISLYTLSHTNNNETTISSFDHILFLISLCSNLILFASVFPLAFMALKAANEDSNIDQILQLIDEEWIFKYSINRRNFPRETFSLKVNPIENILNLCKTSIKTENFKQLKVLITKFENRFINLQNNGKNVFEFYYFEYSSIIQELITTSIESKNQYFIIFLLNRRFLLQKEESTQKNDLKDKNLSYFLIDLDYYFDKTLQSKNSHYLEYIFEMYYEFGEFFVKEKLSKFLPDYDDNYLKYSNEKFFISDFFNTKIISWAIKLEENDEKSVFKFLFKLFLLESSVLDSKSSKSTKKWLVHLLEHSKKESFIKYINLNPQRVSHKFFPFNQLSTIESELTILNRIQIFNNLLWSIKYLTSKSKLNTASLNSLKAALLGLKRINKSNNINIDKPIRFFLDQINTIRKSTKDSKQLQMLDMYVKTYEFFNFLTEKYEDADIDTELKKRMKKLLKKFTNVNKTKTKLEKALYIRDTNIM